MLGGGYLYFRGKDIMKVQSHFHEAPNSFTYEFWAKPAAKIMLPPQNATGAEGMHGQRYVIGAQNTGDVNHAGVGVSVGINGVTVFEHTINHLPPVLVYPTEIQDWVHIAVVYEEKTPLLYINGQLLKIGLTSNKSIVYPCGVFGALPPYGYYTGALDDLRIWKTARNKEQIAALMHVELTGAEDGLVGCWSFNEQTPNTALDCTKNRYHGTLQGTQHRVRHTVGALRWQGSYPKFITNNLDYLARYYFTDGNSEQIQQIVRNTRWSGYQTDVLMMFNVYRYDYLQLYAPVANALARQGRSVVLAVPREEANERLIFHHNVAIKTLQDISASQQILQLANQYYKEHLAPALSQWFLGEGVPTKYQIHLEQSYRQYAIDFMTMTALLHEIKPKIVYALHFISESGYLDAIRNMGEQNPIRIFLMQHGFLFGDEVDSHDFKGADQVLLWGDYHKRFLDHKTDARASISVGNPKLEYVYEQFKLKPNWTAAPNISRVLYISSDSPQRSMKSRENLELAIEAFNSISGIEVTYKLHPVESITDYNEYVSQNRIAQQQLSTRHMNELLLETDLVVGDNSSSVFEAAALGIPVIQIFLPHHNETHLVFTRAASAQTLNSIIQKVITDSSYRESLLNNQKQWTDQMFGEIEGSTQRVVNTIMRFLS
ncbi:LamG-like jellyroll fold domain-containing protein [Paenibacillus terreus]|uniref:LamG-like jellyroll fold domain-containing protein n=1 Tax=Paenibacillus terreus TaxID=1387834 RepID=A0ABV5B7A4_9BACL